MFRPIALVAFGSIALCGCGDREWTVAVENRSDVPCTVTVSLAPLGGTAEVNDVAKGKTVTMIAGAGDTVVKSIQVVRDKDEQTLTPNMPLPAGNRLVIVVDADGRTEIRVEGHDGKPPPDGRDSGESTYY